MDRMRPESDNCQNLYLEASTEDAKKTIWLFTLSEQEDKLQTTNKSFSSRTQKFNKFIRK